MSYSGCPMMSGGARRPINQNNQNQNNNDVASVAAAPACCPFYASAAAYINLNNNNQANNPNNADNARQAQIRQQRQHHEVQKKSAHDQAQAQDQAGAQVKPARPHTCCQKHVDYRAVRRTLQTLIRTRKAEADDRVQKGIATKHDMDGIAPALVRLAWHTSGTYDIYTGVGGSDGCTIRFAPESQWPPNTGLAAAMAELDPVHRIHSGISYGDLYTLAGVIAIDEMGGPRIRWRPGRCDARDGSKGQQLSNLPGPFDKAMTTRELFGRKSLDDRETVAMIGGGHAIGRGHFAFDGSWTPTPTTFSNAYFVHLLQDKWSPREGTKGREQHNSTDGLMMLVADMELKGDPEYLEIVREFAGEYDAPGREGEGAKRFYREFAVAFQRVMESGCQSLGPEVYWELEEERRAKQAQAEAEAQAQAQKAQQAQKEERKDD